MKILIIGAGKLGLPLANRLKSHHQITLVSRSKKDIDGVCQIVKDVKNLNKDDFDNAIFDLIYVILSPDDYTIAGYATAYVESVRPISQAVFCEQSHLIYISSTGVYGQNAGETVDIDTTPSPRTAKDNCLYSAEQLYQAFWQKNLTIVRPSGLINGGLLNTDIFNSERLTKQALNTDKMDAIQWANMVHRETVIKNLAKMVDLHAKNLLKPAYIFNEISEPRHSILNKIREKYGLAPIMVNDNAPQIGKRLINTPLI